MIYKHHCENRNKKVTCVILIVSVAILLGYMIELVKYMNPQYQLFDPIQFILFFYATISVLGTVSAVLSYQGNKKKEVLLTAIMFAVFTIDIFFFNIFKTVEYVNESTYIGVGTSIIKVMLLNLAISKESKLRDIIVNNKRKSTTYILILAFILVCIEYANPWIYGGNIIPKHGVFHTILFFIYMYISIKFMIKGIKQNEVIYSIIGSSILMFSLQSIYFVFGKMYGNDIIHLASISIAYFGFIIISIGLFIEFIQNKNKTEVLAEELKLFYKVIDENDHSCITICDDEDRLIYANKKAREHYREKYNIDVDEIIKKQLCIDTLIISKERYKNIKDKVREELDSNSECDLEMKVDGIHLELFVQRIQRNNKYYKIISFRDVSSKHEMEKTILEYEKIKQQELVRNEFFANISHELKTPLNILYSTEQLLTHTCNDDKFREIYLSHRKSIRLNCQRMLRLIDNIVDITKFETGYKTPEFRNYDIVRLVEEITLSVINYAKRKDINIVFDTEIEELKIRCDQDMIERVMLNLLSNAIKFTHIGGNVDVHLKTDKDWVYISVLDDGVGIPKESQPYVFERFVQVDKTLRRKNEGSGIGLSIVKSIVDLNGGNIYLNSDGKSGTEFKVLLPNKTMEESYNKININRDLDIQKIQLELSDIYEVYGS